MLLHSKKIGCVLRVFAKHPALVPLVVKQTLEIVQKLTVLQVDGLAFTRRVELLVPMDTAYADVDCGLTANALRAALQDCPWAAKTVFVSEVKHGDIYCRVLNYGMARLLRAGCDYGFVVSREATEYVDSLTVAKFVKAASNGARVTGLALHELNGVQAGRVANTMALWHIESLVQQGGFDLFAAQSANDNVSRVNGYERAGTEEIIPLIRLVREFGRCIATVSPSCARAHYTTPSVSSDPLGFARHERKMATKLVRQTQAARHLGVELDHLEHGLCANY